MKEVNSCLPCDPPDRQQRLERFVAHHVENFKPEGYQGVHVDLLECPLCGNLKWVGTSTRVIVETTYSIWPLYECHRCLEVRFRAPEVFSWVTAILSKRDEVDSRCRVEDGALIHTSEVPQ